MASFISVNGFVAEGFKATLGVSTSVPNPVKYLWKRNGQLIGGAPSQASFTTPDLRRGDLGDRYSVMIVGSDGTKEEAPEVGLFKER